MGYKEQLKDGRWQLKKTSVMQRDGFACRCCGVHASSGITLNVHHIHYKKGAAPWEYDDDELITLCESCHQKTHDELKSVIYDVKIGDFVSYDHSDYTNSGIIYDIDFKTMTARMASIDDGSDYSMLWLEIINIGTDGSLKTGNGYDVTRKKSVAINCYDYEEEIEPTYDGYFFCCLADCLFHIEEYYEKGDKEHFYIIDRNLDPLTELNVLHSNLSRMIGNNEELEHYFKVKGIS